MTKTARVGTRQRTLGVTIALLLALTSMVTGCSSASSGGDGNDNGGSNGNGGSITGAADAGQSKDQLQGEITISAAASLTEAFTELVDEFEKTNPGTELTTNFGSSGQLAEQIRNGAPVDVAAFADTTPMENLASEDLLDGPAKTFVRNELVIVTKPGNPEKIKGLEDMASDSIGVVSLCQSNAPCGKFADQIFESSGVSIDPSRITRGQDVKATLGAVTQGDAVAGIVYGTDATSAGDQVSTVKIPADANVAAEYPIAVMKDSKSQRVAAAFVEFVLSDKGRAVLDRLGFLEP